MKSCLLVLDIATAPSKNIIREGAPRLLEALKEVFVPCAIHARLDDVPLTLERTKSGVYHGEPLWSGEEITGSQLTHFNPNGDNLVSQLRTALSSANASAFQLTASGALFHRAPGTSSPAWYARWRTPTSLEDAWTVGFTWDADVKEVEVRFPLGGYPLTSSQLGADRIEDGDADAAVENRAGIFSELAQLPAVLGLTRSAWTAEGDFQRWFPEDAAAIRNNWIAQLRG